MGRIVVPITVTNVFEPTKQVRCEALVDTGAYGLVRIRHLDLEIAS